MTKCAGCDRETDSTLNCPVCLKAGLLSDLCTFCDQECFKASWSKHKQIHGPVNISFPFTGPLRPWPLSSLRRTIPDHIEKPDYAVTGHPKSEDDVRSGFSIPVYSPVDIEGMRQVGRMAKQVLDLAAAALRPGITTDHIDQVVHEECIRLGAYPSPLNYRGFPRSVCTSVNEVICHGIPDMRPLQPGDLVNIDITLYYRGYHGDLNATYLIEEHNCDPRKDSSLKSDVALKRRLIKCAKECLDQAIAACKPGVAYRDLGAIIEPIAKGEGFSVVKNYCGHGIGKLFHCAPSIPHYAKSKAVGIMRPGHIFTIEPMINAGDWRDLLWPDDWTAVTVDGLPSAQFEHTILITEDGHEILTNNP